MTVKKYYKENNIDEDGLDLIDDSIEVPYCCVCNITEIKDNYDKFINYILNNVQVVERTDDITLSVDFVGFIKKTYDKWVKFTNEVNDENFQEEAFEDEDEFIYDGLCPTLENMLPGNYSESDYRLFMEIFEK